MEAMAARCVGFIEFTLCDEQSDRLVSLGGAGWLSAADLEREWDALPVFKGKTVFVADRLAQDGLSILDSKPVSAEIIEAKLGQPLVVLMGQGRKEAQQAEAERFRTAGRRAERLEA